MQQTPRRLRASNWQACGQDKVGTQIERAHAKATNVKDFSDFLEYFYIYDQAKPGLEKIVFHYAENRHYTLHFGMKSKVCDIHHTREDLEPPEKYKTLVRLKHTTMLRLIAGTRRDLEASLPQLMPFERKLSYFAQRGWHAQRMDSEQMMRDGMLIKDEARRRIRFDPGIRPVNLKALLYRIGPKIPQGEYVVHGARKRGSKVIGTLFVRPGTPITLFYLPWERQMRWTRQLTAKAVDIMQRSQDEGALRLAKQLRKMLLGKK